MCRSVAQGGRRCPGLGRVKANIRTATERIAARNNTEWVGLAELREELGTSYDRATVDAALRELARGDSTDGMQVEQETNQKALTARDRAAAVRIGDRDQHVIRVRPAGPSQAEVNQAAARQTAREAAQQAEANRLRGMSGAELRNALTGATPAQRDSLIAEMARRETTQEQTVAEPTERQRAALQHLGIGQYEHVPPPPPRVKGRMSEQRYYDTYDNVRDVTVIDTDGTIFRHCGVVTAHVIAKKQQPGVLVIRKTSR